MFSAQANDGGSSFYDASDHAYLPNQEIPVSGIYEICHTDKSRITALLLRDNLFPSCSRCGEEVRYKLVWQAPHISEDPDFRHSRDNLFGE